MGENVNLKAEKVMIDSASFMELLKGKNEDDSEKDEKYIRE